MAFVAGQVLTATQLNALDINSLTVDTDTLVVDASNDRVGIGTTSPGRSLEVAANVPALRLTDLNNSGVYHEILGDGSSLSIEADDNNQGSSSSINFKVDGTEYARLTSDGRLGIGTTSPSARLHVDAGTTNLVGHFTSTDANALLTLADNSTTGVNYVGIKAAGDALYLRANNSDQVTIATDGSIRATDGSASAPTYVFTSDTNTGFFVTGNNGRIHFSGNGTEGGYLLSTGGRFIDGSASAPSYAFKDDTNTGMFRSGTDEIGFACGGSEVFQILTNGVLVSSGDNYFGVPTTGTGNDAEWSSTGFGTYMLKRNSSLTAEKENISADLGTHLTADMIDSVVPKMWNRLNSPGYPEIGPLAEDMDAISPFLAAHGADITDGTYQEFVTGINKTGYLSLLVLALQDVRARLTALEAG